VLLLFFAAFLTAGRVVAQDSLSTRDAAEIRYKAERMVKTELNELLNSLSNTGYETYEVAESIHDSYAESRNRIFRDSLVLVEPDINPAVVRAGQAGDEPLGKYLRDIDLLYKKSDSATIVFDNIRSSPVKKNDDIYVKVYYNSLFRGRSTVSDQAYAITNRIAEIKAQKDGKQWRLAIVRLAFFNPGDTVGDLANNMPIKYESAVGSLNEQEAEAMAAQLREQEGMDDERFQRMLALGDSAYREKDLITALRHFKDAQELRPRSPEVYVRLKNTTNAMGEFKVESAQLYAGFIEKAQLQEKNRQYKEAIESYQNAIRQKPDESANLQPHIRQLTDKFATLSDLQEKFNAGLIKEALKEYTNAIKKDPNNSDYYLGRGRCHQKLNTESKNIELALKDYTQAYELDHNNLPAIRDRADLYTATGEYFKALTDYTIYLAADRNNVAMYEQKSAVHVRLKMYNEAIADLDEALAIDPKAASVYLSKGLLLMQYGKPGDPQQDIQKASANFGTCLRIDSSNALAWFHRGRCDILLGKLPEAAEDFARAREKGLDSAGRRVIAGYAVNFYNQATAQFA
jgi:tetratricopeptide (TPR) repeat protein